MNKRIGKLKKAILSMKIEEREKRQYARYESECQELEALSERELSSRFVHLKAKYEYRRNIFSFLIGAILLTALTGGWKYFYNFTIKCMQLFYTDGVRTREETSIIIMIAMIFFVFLAVAVFLVCIIYLKELYITKKTLLIIEEVRISREKNEI
ncbi:hypothetical protein [Listeria costaricensis]|uniref:hypothetical protein n=1 Tax=Listeria costaricensis TaxID=2026604 RepID=UPI000C07480C|nr:hypothetical protein [Listeria costaricensis]